MSDLETIVREIAREEVRAILCQTTFGAALIGEPPAPPKRDTIPAPPPARARKSKPKDTTGQVTQTHISELHGILLGYFAASTAPNSWSASELAESVGGDSRDIGRHLQQMAKEGTLVMTGNRRNARYGLPVKAEARNGAAP